MKPKQITLYLIALIITLAACLSIIALISAKTNTDLSNKIDGLKSQIETSQKDITVRVDNSVLLERLEQLSRDNLALEQENSDLEAQLDVFDGMVKGD